NINAGMDSTIYDGSSIILTPSGAGINGNYQWNNGVQNGQPFQPTSTKTYTVYGTDANGCTNKNSVNIIVHFHSTAHADPVLSPICANDTSEIMGGLITGTSPSGYWTGGLGTWIATNAPFQCKVYSF